MTTLREFLGTRNRRATWCRTVLAGAVGMLGAVGLTPRFARAATAPAVAVPAYFWSSTQWDRMLVSSEELRYVVMNPDSGPGTVAYPTFVNKVAAARSQGATVVGYVDTAYGARSLATVKADIDKYRAWYGMNAFFFDQTPYDCAQISYYQDLEDYVRAQTGGFIFHNPGMNPQECYLGLADVVVNFEGSEASYDAWTPAPYAAGYPAARFWHIVYAVDPTHAPALLSSAASRNGGLVFLTEQDMPNPFAVIPTDTLWSAQTPTRAGRKPAPQASPPSTSAPAPTATRIAAPQSASPTTTSPAGAAAETSVTTRSAAPVVAAETTTTTVVTGSAQSASAPLLVEAAPTPLAPTTLAPTRTPLSAPSAAAPAVPSGPTAGGDAFPVVAPAPTVPTARIVPPVATVPPAPIVSPAVTSKTWTVMPWAVAGRDSGLTSGVAPTPPSPSRTRPPAAPAMVPGVTSALGKVAVRVPLRPAARSIPEVMKKTPVVRRRSTR